VEAALYELHGRTISLGRIYKTKAPNRVSWFRSHLDTSLSVIARARPDCSASIIDVGGGESTLVDDLLAQGYKELTVLDISPSNASGGSARRSNGFVLISLRWSSDRTPLTFGTIVQRSTS
jgi:hypothetical protein